MGPLIFLGFQSFFLFNLERAFFFFRLHQSFFSVLFSSTKQPILFLSFHFSLPRHYYKQGFLRRHIVVANSQKSLQILFLRWHMVANKSSLILRRKSFICDDSTWSQLYLRRPVSQILKIKLIFYLLKIKFPHICDNKRSSKNLFFFKFFFYSNN